MVRFWEVDREGEKLSSSSPIHVDSYDVDERLAQLGLTREPFVTAANEHFTAYISCTANHPPTFPGLAAWAEGNRSIRDGLTASGWTRKNEMNQPLVINEAKTIAITAASGDENTGRADQFPCTRSPKGPRTADAVRINREQQRFAFMEDPTPIVASLKIPGRSTWLFLIYRDFEVGELRYELSRPVTMADDGYVSDWAERIVFPPTPLDTDIVRLGRDDGGQSPEITVEIKKLG